MLENLQETTIHEEKIYKGRIISLETYKMLLPNGLEIQRDVVRHPGTIAVLALQDDRMIVVEQFRKPLERSLMEIPAGRPNPGETDMAVVAFRELREETGYIAGSLKHLGSFYTSPGVSDEWVHLYAAENLKKGETEPDADELLRCGSLSLEEALGCMEDGSIGDAKTVSAILRWKLYRLSGTFEL